jgi:hypothetical protein
MQGTGTGSGSGSRRTGPLTQEEILEIMRSRKNSASPSGDSPSGESKKEKEKKSLGDRVKALGKALSPKKPGKN